MVAAEFFRLSVSNAEICCDFGATSKVGAEMKLARYITGFDKKTEKHVWTHYLTSFSVEAYGRFFELYDDHRMFLCYPIAEENKAAIEALSGVVFDLDRYDYFIECGTTDDPEVPGEPLGELDSTTGFPPPLNATSWIEGGTAAVPKTKQEDLD